MDILSIRMYAAPDAITGATLKFFAESVQEAVKEILEKAAGK